MSYWAYVEHQDSNWVRVAPIVGGKRVPMELWCEYEDCLADVWSVEESLVLFEETPDHDLGRRIDEAMEEIDFFV